MSWHEPWGNPFCSFQQRGVTVVQHEQLDLNRVLVKYFSLVGDANGRSAQGYYSRPASQSHCPSASFSGVRKHTAIIIIITWLLTSLQKWISIRKKNCNDFQRSDPSTCYVSVTIWCSALTFIWFCSAELLPDGIPYYDVEREKLLGSLVPFLGRPGSLNVDPLLARLPVSALRVGTSLTLRRHHLADVFGVAALRRVLYFLHVFLSF